MTPETSVTRNGGVIEPKLRLDIEGLRGIAILAVVGFHAGLPGFSGGYVGVDVFFVLSGYLITWLLLREIETTGTVSFVRFYARRARRLFPALSLVLLATMVASWIIYSPLEQRDAAITAGATNLYLSNLYFAFSAMNYHGPDAQLNPLLHTWSLAVEEQFYLVWPVLLFALWRLGRPLKSAQSGRRRLVAAMILLAVGSLALSIWLTRIRQPWAFFSAPTRAWEFALGGLTILFGRTSAKSRPILAGWIGLVALVASVAAFDKTTSFPGFMALLPATGTAAILWSGAAEVPRGISRLLSATWLMKIGRVSYSWYLWHWPVLIFVTALTRDLGLWGRTLSVLMSLLPALLSFLFVEDPIRRRRVLKWQPRYSLAAGVTLCLLGAIVSVGWQRIATRAAISPVQLRLTNAHKDRPLIYEGSCISDLYDRGLNECSFNKPGSSATVVLFGDSHAAQWFPALDIISKQEGWNLVTFIKSACPVADVDFFYPVMGRRYTECGEWRALVLQKIKEMRPRLVVMASADGYAKRIKPLVMVDPPAWQGGLTRTFKALSGSGTPLIYIRDTPEPGFDVPLCLSRAVWQKGWINQTCTVERAQALDDALFGMEQQAVSQVAGVTLLDLTPQICPATICQPEAEQLVIYRDSNHLTASYAASLAPMIRAKLTSVQARTSGVTGMQAAQPCRQSNTFAARSPASLRICKRIHS